MLLYTNHDVDDDDNTYDADDYDTAHIYVLMYRCTYNDDDDDDCDDDYVYCNNDDNNADGDGDCDYADDICMYWHI